jgi:hypothetical protein
MFIPSLWLMYCSRQECLEIVCPHKPLSSVKVDLDTSCSYWPMVRHCRILLSSVLGHHRWANPKLLCPTLSHSLPSSVQYWGRPKPTATRHNLCKLGV